MLAFAVIVALTSVARADKPGAGAPPPLPEPDAAYFYDGGAIPFFYGSLAVALGANLLLEPPAEPRLFDPSEGGKPVLGDTVPEWAVAAYAGAGAALVAAVPREARWFHLKGYLEAVATTLAVTELTKNAVGRHRPQYAEGQDADSRKSFFSGHSSLGAVTSMYLGLYVHRHLLAPYRGKEQSWSWLDVAPAAAFTAVMIAVPATRVHDNRHHVSDVVTGTVVGASLAVAFYAYQEGRFAERDEESRATWRRNLVLVPDLQNRGLAVATRF
jgi:membrane-associated phospholipid phosphatase